MQPTASQPAAFESLESRRLLSASNLQIMHAHDATPAAQTQSLVHAAAATRTTRLSIDAEPGTSFTGVIGKVKSLRGAAADFSNIHVAIDWGDGTTSSDATLTRNSYGSVSITATHTWDTAGTYRIKISLSKTPTAPTGVPNRFFPIHVATLHSVAHVEDANGTGVTFTAKAGQPFTQNLGSFDFVNVDLRLTPTIDWGDGTHGPGTLGGPGLATGQYNVTGTHTYAKAGHYTIHVSVTAAPFGFPGGLTPQFIMSVASWDSSVDVT